MTTPNTQVSLPWQDGAILPGLCPKCGGALRCEWRRWDEYPAMEADCMGCGSSFTAFVGPLEDEQGAVPQPEVRTCELPGCDRPHKAHGMCVRHYRQWQRGTLTADTPAEEPEPDRAIRTMPIELALAELRDLGKIAEESAELLETIINKLDEELMRTPEDDRESVHLAQREAHELLKQADRNIELAGRMRRNATCLWHARSLAVRTKALLADVESVWLAQPE